MSESNMAVGEEFTPSRQHCNRYESGDYFCRFP
jgi:hypothetical protein